MIKVRQDAWSHEDDLLLAETVLRHIREGSTQLKAFDEVGDALNRTSAACGFRWNAEIRNKYEQAIAMAKKQRKAYKKEQAQAYVPGHIRDEPVKRATEGITQSPSPTAAKTSMTSLQDVIQFLSTFDEKQSQVLAEDHEQLQRLYEKQKEEIQELEESYQRLKDDYEDIQEDYQTFVLMMDKARRRTKLDQNASVGRFRMDEDGNFTQVAK
ncbi:RsfA family transcriptional regulator [Aureibacillus halotolerans]|uniref:Prespore-specific regulator n=1 Tax=Aureibacillus halotolerans TaxID=1508390 RepID=A0A4R6U0T8_9BACI|nr:RsfA family transcriptional regulator [Aureibacillus halotolerans]TDQ37999.1 prespore-specific regulator [Aureibacillus halotolerans]